MSCWKAEAHEPKSFEHLPLLDKISHPQSGISLEYQWEGGEIILFLLG